MSESSRSAEQQRALSDEAREAQRAYKREWRAYLHKRGLTLSQLGAWVGVTGAALGRWLDKPLTEERRQRIEAGLNAMAMQREG